MTVPRSTSVAFLAAALPFGAEPGVSHAPAQSITVHRIDAGSNVYIIETDTALIQVDAGYPGNERKILRVVESLWPKPLRLVFVTHAHFDHYGSARAVSNATGAKLGVHVLDAQDMRDGRTRIKHTRNGGFFGRMVLPAAERLWNHRPVEPDIEFKSNDSLDTFGLRARVIHTPGHTKGSASLLVADSLLFVGDLISGQIIIQKQCWYADIWEDIDSSIALLKRLNPYQVFPGHGRRKIGREHMGRL
jgi:glyoxylase-like metal-dependent hydrolase (beta-lactamase superfamily II)